MFSATEITKHFGARTILDTVSLTVGPGERVGLVGRNGCGNSTMLRILAGQDAPDRGASADYGLKAPKIHTLYDISKAQRMLGNAPSTTSRSS